MCTVFMDKVEEVEAKFVIFCQLPLYLNLVVFIINSIELSPTIKNEYKLTVSRMDILILGCYTRFSCFLI